MRVIYRIFLLKCTYISLLQGGIRVFPQQVIFLELFIGRILFKQCFFMETFNLYPNRSVQFIKAI